MAGKIFINYRREDSIGTAGRLYDRLAQTFGRNNLFMDVDHIPAGVDFVEYLHSQVDACNVFLAVIGPNWLNAKDERGRRRFDNPNDYVTIEIAAALARNIRVIPVLVDGARTPKADRLPDSVKPLVRRHAVEVRNTQFGRDAEALANKVREALQDAPSVKKRWPFLARAAAWAPGQWRTVAGSATVLLLVGWIGLYQMGVPVWVPWPDPPRADKAQAAADAEAKRQAAEAEVQRLNEEVQRLTKAAADAEAKLKAAEAEQQRSGTITKAAADAEAKRRAAVTEVQRLNEEVQRQTKAAADAEAKRQAAEAEQQRLAAVKAEEERKPPSPPGLFTMRTNIEAIGSPPVDGKPVRSIGECELSCTQSATCKIFTFRKSTAMCYTYSDATFVPSDYFDTGIRK
jgi:TIR domain/PAN domain